MSKKQNKKYAILCSGGNAPGMSTCIISFIKKCESVGVEPIGIANGFEGLHDCHFIKMSTILAQLFLNDGSALIGTSRCSRFITDPRYRKHCAANLKRHGIDALVIVGGEGSYKGARELAKLGVKVICIPATIDNDIPSTAYTIGFDTCLNKVCEVVSDVNDVFVSHRGVALIEVMGRTCPDLTVRSAIANNATYMVTKYSKLTQDQFLTIAQKGFAKGKPNITFLVTENLYPKTGNSSLDEIAKYLEKKTGYMCRHIQVGYIQRGGKPSARDRLLANYMINIGIEQLVEGKHCKAICRKSRETVAIDLNKAIAMKRRNWNKKLISIFNKVNQE